MKMRILGASKLEVSAVGLGCMGMSMGYGSSNDPESLKTLHHAFERGVTFWDTSDIYGAGHNESLIGKVIEAPSVRQKVVLATKCGLVELGRKVDGSPEYIKKCCDASLKRLKTDVIDLYYLHRADKSVPIEESVGAFADLVKAGKIKHVGLSELTENTLRRAAKIHPITALQGEYSLWERKPEGNEVLKTCRELGIGFVAYSPLGRGFLSGKYQTTDVLENTDFRRILPKFQKENLENNLKLVEKLKVFAAHKKCTPAQVALAWLLAQGEDIVPIPGTRNIQRLDENIASVNIHLSQAELAEINSFMPLNATQGKQYPDEFNLEV